MSKCIMTVDDSPTIRAVLGMTLRDAGFRVVEACNGRDALRKLAQMPVDLLVTDLNMPELGGIDLVREVRGMPGQRFLPIIMLTSESDSGARQLGKAAGASGWIVKPFKPAQLLSVVTMVLR
ncbi:MAG: two-component system response regulator [Desulfuromonadales bacterium GWD2_61_12]|nr:MAG: two-component system response regulator [Desulfuromonadales bacterium GWC2_61_20]OGR32520.1 MAG: two-component system response regulator [Desulfuromonadales bacterium GWD2_61_12]HAD04496.1 two-component system response regulator [Desulfuromonas sp.]HBT83050.1 two-component system response regulator [Desulfuromonas sp.]